MKKFRLNSELSEKQIEADVATFFGWISPDGQGPFRLVDIEEQDFGADKRFDWVIPIYMQFKVSQGLMPISRFDLGRSSTKRIQKFRQNNNLYHNPTLYFKLREIAEHALDYQHNILFKLSRTPNVHAFYVAPLTLLKSEYEKLLFDTGSRYMMHPYYYVREQKIRHSEYASFIKGVPFLRAHISIIPHTHILHANHHYSFSPNGTEIAFHSPMYFNDRIFRLSDVFSRIIDNGSDVNNWISTIDYVDRTTELSENLNLNIRKNLDATPFDSILNFGRALYSRYNIRQILLAINEGDMVKYFNRG